MTSPKRRRLCWAQCLSRMSSEYHIPVMLDEALAGLALHPDGTYVDVTFGGGGHSRAILERLGEGGRLLAFDQDEDAKVESGKLKVERTEKAQVAGQLSRIAIESLAAGKQVCFYPSGHVKTVDKELIGNRRLAYEVCRELPEGVRVILCRMRGLESSIWSKLRPKQWKWRRTVTIVFEDHTDDVRTWSRTLDRRAFNEQLEQWYNQAD